MEVTATGPLPTGFFVWRSRAGALALTVVSKATFALQPGASALAATQIPLLERDEHAGVDPARWLWAPADLVPYKVRGDVLLAGHAHAPGGAPVRRLRVRLAAFGVDKTLEVLCDRRRTLDGRVLEGAPFTRMPLGWDRALGALQNPAGIALSLVPDLYGTTPLPNVAWPDVPLERSAPAGLGPIAAWWPGRKEKLGQRGTAALPTSWKGAVVPEDADDAFFQVAPPDQQPARIDLGGAIYLENLHPAHPQLSTRLARLSLRAVVERPGRAPEPLGLTADTVWFDSDRGVCTVTWRGWVGLVTPDEAGTVRLWTGAAAEVAEPLPTAVPASRPAEKPRWDPRETAAVDPATVLGMVRALPFDQGVLPAAAAPAPAARGFDPRATAAVDPALVGQGSSSMPFAPAPDGAPPPAFLFEPSAAPAARRFDPRATVTVIDLAVPAAPAAPAAAIEAEESTESGPLPFDVPAPAWLGPAAPVEAAAPIAAAPAAVAPPAWIGPAPEPVAEPEPEPDADLSAERKADLERRCRARESLEGSDLSGLSLAGIHLDGASLAGASFANADLSGATLRGASLTRANLSGANLSQADLSGANLTRAVASGANLAGAHLAKAKLHDAELRDVDFTGADLSEARFDGATLDGSKLVRVKAPSSTWDRASLGGCMLAEADFRSASFAEAQCAGADFSGSQLGKASFRGARCDGASFEEVDATGARLTELSAPSANFSRAKLEGAQLRGATLTKASFVEAMLRRAVADGANFSGADLGRADLSRASLRDASLQGASLKHANLEAADLRGADLTRASASHARLTNARLEGSKKDGADGL